MMTTGINIDVYLADDTIKCKFWGDRDIYILENSEQLEPRRTTRSRRRATGGGQRGAWLWLDAMHGGNVALENAEQRE